MNVFEVIFTYGKLEKKKLIQIQPGNFCTPYFNVLNTVHLIDSSVKDANQLGCTCT